MKYDFYRLLKVQKDADRRKAFDEKISITTKTKVGIP